MKIMIEFYRTRDKDDAHAIVGRVTDEAVDREDAINIARLLSQTVEMPQHPDAMTITDRTGQTLYSGIVDTVDQ
jgi:hypothetical protein